MTDHTPSTAAGFPPDVDVIVVGAGFGGLGMLYHLREGGYSVRVFEAGSDVGGTWYWNRYPGARCDSPGEVYQFFFSKELLDEWDWSQTFATQPEILSYLQYVADRFSLRDHITFDTRVESARFDAVASLWRVRLATGQEVTSRFFITAVGCLSESRIPDFPGLDSFLGEVLHAPRWPHEPVDFTGKRVGVIGTGSTGIQVIPTIAAQTSELFVFQRTANYSFPARQRERTPADMAALKASYDDIHEQIRHSYSGQRYQPRRGSAFDVSDEERTAFYQEQWERGGFGVLFNGWEDLMTDERSNETAASFVRQRIGEVVRDPVTRQKLVPHDHPIGTKRPALDSEYFETFNRDNVTLVDVRANPIVEITPSGIRTTDAEYDLDVIIFATGFDAMTGSLLALDILGRDGITLREKWADGPITYLGLAVSGFPNMFTITGPGSPAVLGNMPIGIEQHNEWIRQCLDYMRDHDVTIVEAEPLAEQRWTDHVSELADRTLMVAVDSWYMGSNIPGKPRRFMCYIGGVGAYREAVTEVAENGYSGFRLMPAAAVQPAI